MKHSFQRLSLERLENRDVPSTGTTLVATGIVQSAESLGNVIRADYQRFLARNPDAAGFNFYMAQLQNGVSHQTIEAEFVSSAEYVANHGGLASTWVIGLYRDLLNRLPNGAEVNFWTTEMALGMTPGQVAANFTTSVEHDNVFIVNEYETLLGRGPDFAGLTAFENAMRNGASEFAVEVALLSSNEYVVDHGSNASFFVTGAYQDVLQRSPAIGEINFWATELNRHGGL